MTKTNMYEPAPSPKLLPHMIKPSEVPYFAENLALEESDKRLQELQARRDHRANKKGGKLMAAGALAASVGALLIGGNKMHNDGQPVAPTSDTMEITTTANGQEARMVIATKNANPAQQNAQAVKENNGNLPGTP